MKKYQKYNKNKKKRMFQIWKYKRSPLQGYIESDIDRVILPGIEVCPEIEYVHRGSPGSLGSPTLL